LLGFLKLEPDPTHHTIQKEADMNDFQPP